MFKIGEPPYYECSSRGDKRFSPFFACVMGKSIEQHYQGAKIFKDGTTGLSWREAIRRPAVNREELNELYKELWRVYLLENSSLIDELVSKSGLSDMFGKELGVNQARTLWQLRCEFIKRGTLL